MARPEIRPTAGFCIQTDSLGTPAGRWYLNMCRHKLVEMPVAYSGKVVSREFILGHGVSSMKIPFDMGSFRKLKERAEGAKQTAYCVDVVFNPFIIQMFMDDEFNTTMSEYRPFIINLALQRIEASIGVKLSTQKVKLVKKFFYKDGEGPNADIPRDFTELPDEMDDSVEEMAPQRKAPPPAEPEEVLIQDVTPGNKKPAMKKGFLNKASKALYPEGSKEGVLPENAGDPMGYLPKGLRKNCKIVDTGAPEYQENEKKRRAAEEQNDANKEFSDLLQKDLAKWNKPGNQWDQNDLPDGIDTPATQKYEVDYSRFDKVVEEVSETKPAREERDWYYDENGVLQSHSASKPSRSEPEGTATKSEPAMKKGFLESAKSALYPKGSEQRAPPDESEMMKRLGEDKDFMRQLLAEGDLPEPQSAKPQAQKPTVTVKVPEMKAPEFTLERDDTEGLFQLVVDVPGLASMQGVDLDVTESLASLAFPSAVGLKPLKVELPAQVVPSSVKAKFSKKTQQLTVKLPLLLKVAKAG